VMTTIRLIVFIAGFVIGGIRFRLFLHGGL
jgi:hypothetical protein